MPANTSEIDGPLVIELVGPLIDDGGGFSGTLGELLAREGVRPRPGSLEQVDGAAAAWALATLLEGHGRSGEHQQLATLAAELSRCWVELARSGRPRPRTGAVAAVRAALPRRPVALLTGLPRDAATALLDAAGLGEATEALVIADGSDGLPRPTRLADWLAANAPTDAAVIALLASPAALLAAIGSRCSHVVLIGDGSPAARLLAERNADSIEAALSG